MSENMARPHDHRAFYGRKTDEIGVDNPALIACAICALAVPAAHADAISDAAKLGATAGAMKYCRENFATDEDEGRYKLLAVAAGKELGDLSEGKTKALLMKKAAEEDGEYLGKPLDQGRCESIRKILATKYAID